MTEKQSETTDKKNVNYVWHCQHLQLLHTVLHHAQQSRGNNIPVQKLLPMCGNELNVYNDLARINSMVHLH